MDKLEELRKQIDQIDTQLFELLQKRFLVVAEVGQIKKDLGLKPLDLARWSVVLERNLSQAQKLNLRAEFVKKILDTIHEEALFIEK